MGVRGGRGTSPERGGPHRSGCRQPGGRGPEARLETVWKVLTESSALAVTGAAGGPASSRAPGWAGHT